MLKAQRGYYFWTKAEFRGGDYETLNAHEFVTRERNPKLVRSWSEGSANQVRRKWDTFIDTIKVVRIGIIQINLN